MSDGRGFVCVLVVGLHFPEAHSLKAKRAELKPVTAGLRSRFGASVAEVDHQDLWQRATLTVALAAGSPGHLEDEADGIERWLDARLPQGASVRRFVVSTDDLEGLGSPDSGFRVERQ